jgi:hypothetical protein
VFHDAFDYQMMFTQHEEAKCDPPERKKLLDDPPESEQLLYDPPERE